MNEKPVKPIHIIVFIIGVFFIITILIINIVKSYHREKPNPIKEIVEVIKEGDDVITNNQHEIKENIDEKEIRNPNQERLDYLKQDAQIHQRLYDIVVEFNDYIIEQDYEKAYELIDKNKLNDYFPDYGADQLKSFINALYEEFEPYDGPLLFNMSDYNIYDGYYVCRIRVVPDHVGDEGLKSDIDLNIEFSVKMSDTTYKLVPYSVRQLDSIYK